MKKGLVMALICAMTAATVMTGCGSSEKEQSSNSEVKAEETEETEAAEEAGEEEAAAETAEVNRSGFGDYSDYTPAKDTYNFVFIPKLVHEWYEDVRAGIDVAVAELAEAGVTVNYTWDAPATAEVTTQNQKVESAASTKPDGISLALIDPSATTAIINDVVNAGIPVSTFDNDAPDSNRVYYCGHSTNYEDGAALAEMLGEKLGGEGQVGILAGSLSAVNHQERVQGFKETLEEKYPNIEIVDTQADEDTVEKGLSITEGWLATYPDLKGIFGCNGASPNGAARAVKDAGKSGEVIIVGMGEDEEAMNFIQDGTIYASLKQTVPAYGYNSVYNMIRIADGEEPVIVKDDLPATIVTAENVGEFLN